MQQSQGGIEVENVVVQVPISTFTRMDDRLKWLVWLMAGNLGLGLYSSAPEGVVALSALYLAVKAW